MQYFLFYVEGLGVERCAKALVEQAAINEVKCGLTNYQLSNVTNFVCVDCWGAD